MIISKEEIDRLVEELIHESMLLTGVARELQGFLWAALAKASSPFPEVDWDNIRTAEAAYERGETVPFRPRVKSPTE